MSHSIDCTHADGFSAGFIILTIISHDCNDSMCSQLWLLLINVLMVNAN